MGMPFDDAEKRFKDAERLPGLTETIPSKRLRKVWSS